MLTGKTVFITGSSRGIGAAIARLARSHGAIVILHGRTSSEALIRLNDELNSAYVTFDITDEEAVEKVVSRLGAIDVLINNVGINPSKTFFQLSNMEWQQIFATNFFGVVNVTRPVLSVMLERGIGGSIVNIASIKGFAHVSGKPAYAASKAALIQLTARMAEEFAPHHIRVNAVAPGFTATELTATTIEREVELGKTTLRDQIAKIPMRRMATTEEIAEAVCWLASDKASYITGQCLAVDGGLSIV